MHLSIRYVNKGDIYLPSSKGHKSNELGIYGKVTKMYGRPCTKRDDLFHTSSIDIIMYLAPSSNNPLK